MFETLPTLLFLTSVSSPLGWNHSPCRLPTAIALPFSTSWSKTACHLRHSLSPHLHSFLHLSLHFAFLTWLLHSSQHFTSCLIITHLPVNMFLSLSSIFLLTYIPLSLSHYLFSLFHSNIFLFFFRLLTISLIISFSSLFLTYPHLYLFSFSLSFSLSIFFSFLHLLRLNRSDLVPFLTMYILGLDEIRLTGCSQDVGQEVVDRFWCYRWIS